MDVRTLITGLLVAVLLAGGCAQQVEDDTAADTADTADTAEQEPDDVSTTEEDLGYADSEGFDEHDGYYGEEALEPTDVELTVEGDPTVLYQEYGLPDTTGYSTAVAFTLTNPTDLMVFDASYRVEISDADGNLMERSDTQTVTMWPGQTRDVVVTLSPSGPSGPVNADVQVYTADGYPLEEGDPMLEAGLDQWETDNIAVTCDEFTVGCDVSGDLIFNGEPDMDVRTVTVVARNADGQIIGAGADQGNVTGTVRPGRPVPFEVHVIVAEGDQAADTVDVTVDADWGSAL